MIRVDDIHSLTDFQRNARAYIEHVTETKDPIAITVNGKAEVVVQDAQSYQDMVDKLARLDLIHSILQSEEDFAAGRTFTSEEVFGGIARAYGLPS